MRHFQESRKLPYNAELLNHIVLDVERYPEFIPWCNSAKIISKHADYFIAELEIVFKGFAEKYKSRIIPTREHSIYFIKVEAISGPFKYLTNNWKISAVEDGSEVDFDVSFQFKSKMLDMAMGIVFSIATEKLINAFEMRAKKHSLG